MSALAALALSAPQVLAAPVLPPAASPSSAAPGAPQVVTLITGDRVAVLGKNQESVSIIPGPGREHVRFITRRISGGSGRVQHLYVIPEDAIALLRSDKVDRRLFDVSLLLDFEYDDATRLDLPLIVTYQQRAPQPRAAARSLAVGTAAKGDLPVINGTAVSSDKSQLQALWGTVTQQATTPAPAARPAAPSLSAGPVSDVIKKVWLDGLRRPRLDRSVPQIGAPAAWAAGFQGDGVVVAVLDTGVDTTHPDLADAVIVTKNFTEDPDVDEVGHGTHVASIIAGSGAAEGGRYRGVAPHAQLLAGKVCEGFGCPDSSMIAGMEWAVEDEGARVVNLSIGGSDEPGIDPLEEAVNTLSAQHNTLFVIAAGNSGPDLYTVESPGSSDAALTVAAVDRDDSVAWFSSRGPRVGDSAFKPDLAAPGVEIVAARAAGTLLGEPVGDKYVAVSGTSMATPHAAGAAALLFQQHPDWSAAQIKAVLMGSAAFNPSASALEQGAGRLDVANAIAATLVADTPSVSFGTPLWPHQDDAPIQRTVTLRNLGAATQLVLQLDMLGPEGVRPPSQMFTVSPSALNLPAGGTGTVTLTANTAVDVADGVYSGRLIASDGADRSVAVPLAVYREIESYDLSLRFLDRTGKPATNYFGLVVSLDAPGFSFVSAEDGVEGDRKLRLPKGSYVVESSFFTENEPYTLISAPGLELNSERLLVFDQRKTSPTTLTKPTSNAEALALILDYQIIKENSGFASTAFLNETSPLYYGATLKPIPQGFQSSLHAQWTDASTTPQSLHAGVWTAHNGLISGAQSIPPRKSAVVHASYSASLGTNDLINELSVQAITPGAAAWGIPTVTGPLPLQRTEYLYADDKGTRWLHELWMHDEEYSNSIIIGWVPREFRAGHSYASRWNNAMFSLSLPEETLLPAAAARTGDTIRFFPSMYTDGDRHAGYVVNEGRSVLFRNGEKLAELAGVESSFDVPPEPGKYRLELDHAQSLFELTSKQRVVWEFESEHVAQGEKRLPLLVIQFEPALDERGRAERNGRFCLPLSVLQFGRSGTPSVRDVSLEVSFDDGVTWSPAQVERNDKGWSASYDHPRRGDYVSLRARTRDRQGNSVEQTVIRAYGLAARH